MINLYFIEDKHAPVKVIGVGAAGNSAVNHMIECGLQGVDFMAANTGIMDEVHIAHDTVMPDRERLREAFRHTGMVFIVAGMGESAGISLAPAVAEVAKKMNILTVAIVTMPCVCEGQYKTSQAEAGIEALRRHVDTLFILPTQTLVGGLDTNASRQEVSRKMDDVLLHLVRDITDLITRKCYMNVDMDDLRNIMGGAGFGCIGYGSASGKGRAMTAARRAVSAPFLDEEDVHNARNIIG